jgi:hypothetical protein
VVINILEETAAFIFRKEMASTSVLRMNAAGSSEALHPHPPARVHGLITQTYQQYSKLFR